MIDPISSFIFNYAGGSIRWLYGTIWRTIANKKKYTYKEYINGPKNSDDWFDLTGHAFVNRIVALFTIVLLAILMHKLNI